MFSHDYATIVGGTIDQRKEGLVTLNRFTTNRIYQRPREVVIRLQVNTHANESEFAIICVPDTGALHPPICGSTAGTNRDTLLEKLREKLLEILRVGRQDVISSPDPNTPGGAFKPTVFGVQPGPEQLTELLVEYALVRLETKDEVALKDLISPP
ncbi:MAG TPA: hypothetical protein VK145_00985 [Candidatus Nanoarchaeia archaeon]|nr:hypothetical protein [Candidatus Nanoarchaeia archaeon]